MNVVNLAKKIKHSSLKLFEISEEQRQNALRAIALELKNNERNIIKANQKDLEAAQKIKLSGAIMDRLTLNEKRIQAMIQSCEDIASFEQVVGTVVETRKRPNGLQIKKVRVPIGVIAMIFESRPNVVIEALALAIKSGNALILKGGKEAAYSNKILFQIAQKAVSPFLPKECYALVESRDDVKKMLKLKNEIDLIVPRGGSSLVNYVKENALMPVIAHDKGLCHIYIDESAEPGIVGPIILNAKTQRPGVCNAMETLLVHKNFPNEILKQIIDSLINKGVEIRGCEKSRKLDKRIKKVTLKDFATEYLDLKMSMKIVNSIEEAIKHIQQYGSHHTESILTKDTQSAIYFENHLDASCIVVNASTRFNDGGELGLGAELGISTSKLHAYGPMGVRELTTSRFLLEGSGQIRS